MPGNTPHPPAFGRSPAPTPPGTGPDAGPAAAGRSRLRRISWLGVLVLGVTSYLLILRTLVRTQNVNYVPSLILVGSITVPMAVLTYARGSGRTVHVSTGLLAWTAITGGIVGTVAAGTWEYDALQRLGTVPMSFVGLAEEGAKLLVPLVVLLVTRPRDPRPGVIVGVAAGMGFATLETMGYGFQALLAARGDLSAVDNTLLLRGLLSPAGHVAWTGVTTAALWRIPGAASRPRALGRAAAAFLLAVLLHTAWDAAPSLLLHVVIAAVSVGALMTLIHRAHSPHPHTPGGGATIRTD